MKLLDLSQPLFDGSPNCPVHPPVRIERIADHAQGGWRMELLTMASHTGSHVDAPLHKVAGGKSTEELPLASFAGPAVLADLRHLAADAAITATILAAALPDLLEDRIVLLATGWGAKRAKTQEWLYQSPRVDADGARWLVERKVRGVGIDHFSIGGSREPANGETHQVLLGAGLWIVEELNFPPEAFALPQPFPFWCLPVNFGQQSGAFCRPVAVVAY